MVKGGKVQREARNISSIATKQNHVIDHTNQSFVSEISIDSGPFAGQKTNSFKLGPFFKPECVKDILPSLDGFPETPSLSPFIFSPKELRYDWAKQTTKPFAGWTTSHDSTDWFNRLSSKHEKWKSQRIYEFLKLSTYPAMPFDRVITTSLICCWNPCLNVFITGRGPMTVTLEDIAYITGLSPSGLDLPYHKHVTNAVDSTKILFRRSFDAKVVANLSFSSYYSAFNRSREEEVTTEEEILFINFAICKFLMGRSINVYRTFLPLAANIVTSPENVPLALGPFLLAQFYRCMFKSRTSESVSQIGGPLWLLTLWGFLYFPSLVSIKSKEEVDEVISDGTFVSPSSACCYGEVAIHLLSIPSGKTVSEVLPQLLDSRTLVGLNKMNWHPCSAKDEMDAPLDCFSSWAKVAAPLWLLETSPIMFKSEDSAHWQSILAPRDLLYVGPQTIGAEVYNPNLAARQFGMIQACCLPFYQTQNRPWGTRVDFLVKSLKKSTLDELDRKYLTEESVKTWETFKITKFNVQPWFCLANVDEGFQIWWKEFLRRTRKAKTFTTNQKIIFKAVGERQARTKIHDMSQSSIETQKETAAAVEVPSSEKASHATMQDATPFSFRSQRTKKRISASASSILEQQREPTMEKVTNNKVAEDEEDDTILLCRLKRKRTNKSDRNITSFSSGASSEDRVSDTVSLNTLRSCKETVCISTLNKKQNIGAKGDPAMSSKNIEANEDLSMLLVTLVPDVEASVQGTTAIPRSSMPEETTAEGSIAETTNEMSLKGPNNINLASVPERHDVTPQVVDEHPNRDVSATPLLLTQSGMPSDSVHQPEDMEGTFECYDVPISSSLSPLIYSEEITCFVLPAPDSVKAYGKLSARIEHVLKSLSHSPATGVSLLEMKKASLLDNLEQLVKDPTSFDNFISLIRQAQEFTEIAPASFQSTMDHLKKSIGSIQELSYKLKDQGPGVLSSLVRKPELTASMETLKLEVEKKVHRVNSLQRTHINICTRIDILEAELMQLQGQRDEIEEQLANADDELSSLSEQLDASITNLEGEAAKLARAESMRINWDQDMKVFKSAIIGIIEQLRSL